MHKKQFKVMLNQKAPSYNHKQQKSEITMQSVADQLTLCAKHRNERVRPHSEALIEELASVKRAPLMTFRKAQHNEQHRRLRPL